MCMIKKINEILNYFENTRFLNDCMNIENTYLILMFKIKIP